MEGEKDAEKWEGQDEGVSLVATLLTGASTVGAVFYLAPGAKTCLCGHLFIFLFIQPFHSICQILGSPSKLPVL